MTCPLSTRSLSTHVKILIILHGPFEFHFLLYEGFILEHKTCDILAAERLQLMRFDNRLIIVDSLKVARCSGKKNNENTIYFHKSWDSFGNLFQKEKMLCHSIISKGKTKAPAVLTGIL